MAISTGTRGTIAEFVVQADLLAMGLEVFSSVSPNCQCDLVAGYPSESWLLRIEVKNAAGYSGYVSQSKKKLRVENSSMRAKNNSYHVLAVVLPNGSVQYRPPPPWSQQTRFHKADPRQNKQRVATAMAAVDFDWDDLTLPARIVDLKDGNRRTIKQVTELLGLPAGEAFWHQVSIRYRAEVRRRAQE